MGLCRVRFGVVFCRYCTRQYNCYKKHIRSTILSILETKETVFGFDQTVPLKESLAVLMADIPPGNTSWLILPAAPGT